MSKIIRVPHGDIKLSVSESGSIILDSQLAGGTVSVKTGNFSVSGSETTVNTERTSFYDNIITVNNAGFDKTSPRDNGNSGFCVSIDNNESAFFVFDKNINYKSPRADFSGSGGFGLKYSLDQSSLLGLRTNSISSYDSDINLETPMLIRVVDSNESGFGDYLSKINAIKEVESGNYTGNLDLNKLSAQDMLTSHDVVSTVGYVDQEITRESEELIHEKVYKLQRGNSSVSRVVTRSGDTDLDGYDSVDIEIENKTVSHIKKDYLVYNGLKIVSDRDNLTSDTIIENTRHGRDLVLRSSDSWPDNNNSSVRIDDILELSGEISQNSANNIIAPGGTSSENVNGVKIYGSKPGPGRTGIYYVNSENTRDELISKQRALFMSMIF